MKHLKKTLLTVLLTGVLFALTGCGGGSSKEVTVDTASLAKELTDSTVTSDTLTEAQSSMLSTIYYFTDDQTAGGTAYMSSGATACEVVVVECKDAKQTSAVEELFKTRVKNQSELYASYNAEEVTKLDNAIIKSAGKYTVLVVCDDTAKAESILKEAGF